MRNEDLHGMPEPEKNNDNKIKTLMGVAIILGVAFIVLVFGSVLLKNAAVKGELVFPESGLSDSIFDSQNGSYAENEELPYNRALKYSPYSIDVPSDVSADVEDGTSYTISSSDYAFVTEYAKKDKDNRPTIISKQLGKAYIMDLSLEHCIMEEVASEEGFLNGNAMHYYGYKAQFANKDNAGYIVYIMGYEVDLTEDMSVYFAISTKTATTEALNIYKKWLDAMAMTLRYDSAVADAIEEQKALEEQETLEEQEQEAEQTESQEVAEAEETEKNATQSYYDQWYQSQHETVQVLADGTGTQKIDCATESAYKNASFTFTFTSPSEDFTYHMVAPDGQTIEQENLIVSGETGDSLIAYFSVTDAKKGVYSIIFDSGSCTYTTPAFIMEDYTAYSNSELVRMQLEEQNIANEETGTENVGAPTVESVSQ